MQGGTVATYFIVLLQRTVRIGTDILKSAFKRELHPDIIHKTGIPVFLRTSMWANLMTSHKIDIQHKMALKLNMKFMQYYANVNVYVVLF